jgi:hypothetical protein
MVQWVSWVEVSLWSTGRPVSNGMVHIWVESLQPALFEQRVGKVQQAMDGVFETTIVIKILHSLCIYPLETMFRSVVVYLDDITIQMTVILHQSMNCMRNSASTRGQSS